MPLVDRVKLAQADWYGHVLSTGDDPSLLARRYRPHGHRDELSQSQSKPGAARLVILICR